MNTNKYDRFITKDNEMIDKGYITVEQLDELLKNGIIDEKIYKSIYHIATKQGQK